MGFGLSSLASSGASLKSVASSTVASVTPGASDFLGAGKARIVKLEKAVLTCLPTGKSLTVAFNPSEYVINREAYYAEHKSYFGNTTHLEFKSVRRRQMEVTLFFDTTDTGEDVSEQTKVLEKFMDMIPQPGSNPAEPVLSFEWGTFKFVCVLEDLTMRFTKFTSEGNPLRVAAKCVFTEFSGAYKEAENDVSLGDSLLGDLPLEDDLPLEEDLLNDSTLDMSFDAVPAGSMIDDSSFMDISFDNIPGAGSIGASATGALGGVTGAATGALNGVTGDLSAKASGLAGGAMNSATSKANEVAGGAMNSATSKAGNAAGEALGGIGDKVKSAGNIDSFFDDIF
ncbi:MAG TPA: hypothetical protein DCO86_04430 [Spirochaetaceae bacterium]|nr:hypothetical protein [Spirochaetaceae bacterium]